MRAKAAPERWLRLDLVKLDVLNRILESNRIVVRWELASSTFGLT